MHNVYAIRPITNSGHVVQPAVENTFQQYITHTVPFKCKEKTRVICLFENAGSVG